MGLERSIGDVVESLNRAKERGKGATILIGAGCSVKAGIPTAAGFVEIIKEKYPRAYDRASPKTYPHCMKALAPGDRRELIARYVKRAKINWAHLAIAQLMKEGYIDRVLTTNFDHLVVQACALVGLFPAVYDFAASTLYKPDYIPKQAVLHLHGQYTGFVLMTTEEEVKRQAQRLEPVFEDAGQGRPWLVVGYSGENDPVFDHLTEVKCFDHNLYWATRQDGPPAAHVRQKLLVDDKYAFYVSGHEADDLFVLLGQRLECFPPALVERPFSHLKATFEMLTPYTLPGQRADSDVTARARSDIGAAIERYEGPPREAKAFKRLPKRDEVGELASRLQTLFLAGKYEEAAALAPPELGKLPQDLVKMVAWSYVMVGVSLGEKARQRPPQEADSLLEQAGQKFEAALGIKPDMPEALSNWGAALARWAEMKEGQEADRLFELAGQKCEAALRIKSDMPEALSNWGNALAGRAGLKEDREADQLFEQTGQKYEAALRIKPDTPEVLSNWGLALAGRARLKEGREADRLFELAGQKYEAALRIKPDMPEALNNWGNALLYQARLKEGEEAEAYFAQAREKLELAEAQSPGSGAYNLACVSALQGREEECRRWLEKSHESGRLPGCEHLRGDSDLDRVRDRDWFKNFISEVCPEKASSGSEDEN